MILNKILEGLQLLTTFAGAFITPINDCIFGFFAFAIGCTDALIHLALPQNATKDTGDTMQVGEGHTNVVRVVMESAHDYLAVGLINMELHHLSSKYPYLSVFFCIPMALDILAQLFGDIECARILMYLKQMNMMAHSTSIGYLAKSEFNIWFGGVWLATMIVNFGIYAELSWGSAGRVVKLLGYILFYAFAMIGIYDDDFLTRLEWFFNMGSTLEY